MNNKKAAAWVVGTWREHLGLYPAHLAQTEPNQCFQPKSCFGLRSAKLHWILIIATFAFHGSQSFSLPDLYLKQSVMDVHANRKTNSWSPFIYAKNLTPGETSAYHIPAMNHSITTH